MTAVIGVDVVPRLDSIRVPLLYLQATEDRVVPPSAAQTILDTVPRSRLVEVDAPHFLLQTRPQAAATAIHEFLRELEHAL